MYVYVIEQNSAVYKKAQVLPLVAKIKETSNYSDNELERERHTG